MVLRRAAPSRWARQGADPDRVADLPVDDAQPRLRRSADQRLDGSEGGLRRSRLLPLSLGGALAARRRGDDRGGLEAVFQHRNRLRGCSRRFGPSRPGSRLEGSRLALGPILIIPDRRADPPSVSSHRVQTRWRRFRRLSIRGGSRPVHQPGRNGGPFPEERSCDGGSFADPRPEWP